MVQETERREAMERLATVIGECRKCPLWEDACHAVPGDGSVAARLMLIGEAPGKQEDLTGMPFVGRAGKLLDGLLAGIDLSRTEIFIGNIVKHRPPGNRDPRDEEIRACTPYLEEQIRIVQPEVIVTLGRHSSRYILSFLPVEFDRITDIRRTVYPCSLRSPGSHHTDPPPRRHSTTRHTVRPWKKTSGSSGVNSQKVEDRWQGEVVWGGRLPARR